MQFKYPELLWALFLLLIPIFIHLFQLRRFKKTAFTNVKLLQKVVAESRRGNTLKKWLLLITRLALFAALIIAFAQPFFAEKTALKEKETVIYLDNSFSMQAKTKDGTLLGSAVQELIKAIPKENTFSLFTNDRVFRDVTLKDIQNDLLSLSHTQQQLQLDEVYLKAKTFFGEKENTVKNLVAVSDFQLRIVPKQLDSTDNLQKHLVQLLPDQMENVVVDTVYINSITPENMELTTILSCNTTMESIPVSLFNGEKLIAKTSATFETDKKAEVSFSLPSNEVIHGKIEILDMGLAYDNQLFFNIDQKEKIKVLAINNGNIDYLQRIFTGDEFQFSSFPQEKLNYGLLASQNLIVLNELTIIPNALRNALKPYVANGGSLVVIPSKKANLNSYNQLLANFFSTAYTQQVNAERNITDIAFSHPLYENVFEKEVTNFQYPKVSQYLRIKTTAPKILSFGDNDAFLVGSGGVYVFTASIANENSNFKNSPLIVPTLYNMGVNSLKLPKLYNTLGNVTNVDVPIALPKDKILKVAQRNYEFIPQQQSYANKVSLTFGKDIERDGVYSVSNAGATIRTISFNYHREESKLTYLNLENINANTKQGSIASLFQTMENDNRVTELWKWFVILALSFVLIEILIQKYLK